MVNSEEKGVREGMVKAGLIFYFCFVILQEKEKIFTRHPLHIRTVCIFSVISDRTLADKKYFKLI